MPDTIPDAGEIQMSKTQLCPHIARGSSRGMVTQTDTSKGVSSAMTEKFRVSPNLKGVSEASFLEEVTLNLPQQIRFLWVGWVVALLFSQCSKAQSCSKFCPGF